MTTRTSLVSDFISRMLALIIIACFLPTVSLASEEIDPKNVAQTEEPATEEARKREQSVAEDPLAQRQADLVDRPVEWSEEPNELSIYGSVRIRYRDTDSGSVLGDGGSRVGLSGQWQFKPKIWMFGRGEAGVDILDQIDLVLDRGASSPETQFGDTVFLRLIYLGVETPDFMVTAGKAWSTYYQVTSFTDRFQGTGASASGTYNAGTDGGNSGTGRADKVLQARVLIKALEQPLSIKPFKLNLQVQHGEPIPKADEFKYKTTFGFSALLETRDDLTVGLAYNHANIDSADLSELRSIGIDDDATAASLGIRWFSEEWYLGTIVTRLENHEATNDFIYFDGWGWEAYGQYNVYKRWWAVGGWNILNPDSSEEQAGDFQTNYSVLGVRYSFSSFQQMIFANARLDFGKTQEGLERGNIYTIGVRWDLP